jgi:hypothetical protein
MSTQAFLKTNTRPRKTGLTKLMQNIFQLLNGAPSRNLTFPLLKKLEDIETREMISKIDPSTPRLHAVPKKGKH